MKAIQPSENYKEMSINVSDILARPRTYTSCILKVMDCIFILKPKSFKCYKQQINGF